MFQDAVTEVEVLQGSLDILNAKKFRDLTARAMNAGYVLSLCLEPADEVEDEPENLGRFSLPMQDRLAAVEADLLTLIEEDAMDALVEALSQASL